LEELVALNDEMAALVRAGVPLEKGLRDLGDDLPGWLGHLARRVADRMERGELLADVFADEPRSFPPIYRAVVEAGLKSGRLAVALEALAGSARRLVEARQIVLAGLWYPLLVFLVAWGFFVLFVVKVAPAFAGAFPDVPAASRGFLRWLAGWGDSVWSWGPAVPAVVVTLAFAWMIVSARATSAEPPMASLLLGWLPWTRRMIHAFRIAMFSEILALLVDNRVPLPEALVLAAEAVGSRWLTEAARKTALAIERGNRDASPTASHVWPPLFDWLLATGQDRGILLPTLRQAASIYHHRAREASEAARLLVPLVLAVGIGGTVTIGYALVVFGSWVAILHSLADMLR
jgi:general secretion pathway protein F